MDQNFVIPLCRGTKVREQYEGDSHIDNHAGKIGMLAGDSIYGEDPHGRLTTVLSPRFFLARLAQAEQ